MSTARMEVRPRRMVDFFGTWDATQIPHLAVVGRVRDGRTDVVDRLIEYFAAPHATTVMIYPSKNPQRAQTSSQVRGALEAEDVLKQHLAELHHRYSAIEKRSSVSLAPIVIIVDSLDELLATTADPQRIYRLQLDLEAIAILGKPVGLHLVFSGDELPYLAQQARADLGTIVIGSERNSLETLPKGGAWFFHPRSAKRVAVQLNAGGADS